MEKLEELMYLKDRSLLIIDFMLNKINNDFFMLQYRGLIEKAFQKNDLKGLKTLSRDANAWAKGIPQKDIQELEELLLMKFGENISGDKITHQVIQKVLVKGIISTQDEYRIVSEYLKDISKEDPYFDKMEELEELLKN